MWNIILWIVSLQLDFKECFHEHKSTRTIPVYYKMMDYTYKYVKSFVYHFFVFVFGIVFAILFAMLNGIMSFIHVWIFGPTLKLTLLWIYAVAPLATAPVRAIYVPLVDATARIFRQIRLQARLSGPIPEYIARERCTVWGNYSLWDYYTHVSFHVCVMQ